MHHKKKFLAIYVLLLTICFVWGDCYLENKEESIVKINCDGGDLIVSQKLRESIAQASEINIDNVCLKVVNESILISIGIKFEKVTHLSLSSICKATIEENTFSKMIKLDTLILNLKLEKMDPKSLNGLGHLKHLDLSNNNICILADGNFDELKGLESLNLSRNSIEEINGTGLVFGSLQNLTEINLANNNLSSLEIATFGHGNLKNKLQNIDLSGNKITSIDKTFNDFNLVSLNLNNNPIKTWESFITNRLKVDKLYLVNTSISDSDLEHICQETHSVQEIFVGKNEENQWKNILRRKNIEGSKVKIMLVNETNPVITYNETTSDPTSQSPTETPMNTTTSMQSKETVYTQRATMITEHFVEKSSPLAIAGIVIAVACVLATIAACIFILRSKFRGQSKKVPNDSDLPQEDIPLRTIIHTNTDG